MRIAVILFAEESILAEYDTIRRRQRLLAAFTAEATMRDRKELTTLAAELAEAEDQALKRAEQLQ